jgi:hypothetical protein
MNNNNFIEKKRAKPSYTITTKYITTRVRFA